MTAIAAAVMAGAAAGLSIAIPFGPTSLYLIERTLCDGARAGVVTGLGVATVHVAYSCAALALGIFTYGGAHGAALMTMLSGLVLTYFALRTWRRQLLPIEVPILQSDFRKMYFDAIAFGSLNPLTPALCAAALTAMSGAVAPGGGVIFGVFIGSLIWWSALTMAVSAMRQTIGPGTLRFANRLASILLAGLAISMLFRGAHDLATGVF